MWTPIVLALILVAIWLVLRRVTAWRREIERALRLEREGDSQEAERILRGIVDGSQGAPESLRSTVAGFHLGAFFMRAQRYREAMERLREPLRSRLDVENELTIRAMIRTALEALGMPDLAEDEERKMAELISSVQEPSVQAEWRGQLLLEQARPDEAVEHLRASVEKAPPGQLGRVTGRALKAANACLLAGRYDEAKEAARHTVELRPPPAQMAMALAVLGSANASVCDFEAAEKCAREARRLAEEIGDDELRARTLGQSATVSLYKAEFDKAQAAAESIEEIEAPRAELYFLHGEILRHKGDFDAAIECYRRAVQQATERHAGYADSNIEAASILAEAWAEYERGDPQRALSKLDALAGVRRILPLLRRDSACQRAVFLAALGRTEESESEMQAALALYSNSADSRRARISRAGFAGVHKLLVGRPEEAAECFRKALAESPPPKDDARLRFHLAQALRATGDEEGARAQLQKAADGPECDHYARQARQMLKTPGA